MLKRVDKTSRHFYSPYSQYLSQDQINALKLSGKTNMLMDMPSQTCVVPIRSMRDGGKKYGKESFRKGVVPQSGRLFDFGEYRLFYSGLSFCLNGENHIRKRLGNDRARKALSFSLPSNWRTFEVSSPESFIKWTPFWITIGQIHSRFSELSYSSREKRPPRRRRVLQEVFAYTLLYGGDFLAFFSSFTPDLYSVPIFNIFFYFSSFSLFEIRKSTLFTTQMFTHDFIVVRTWCVYCKFSSIN